MSEPPIGPNDGQESGQESAPAEQPAAAAPGRVIDLEDGCMSSIKCVIEAAQQALCDEDGRTPTSELAIAVRKLREAVMWIDEHQRLS